MGQSRWRQCWCPALCLCATRGKKAIKIQADHFIKGGDNPWPELFDDFAKQIKANTSPELYATVNEGKFTTTDEVALIACETEYPLQFKVGFVGATQDANGAITPQLSWAVIEESKDPKPKSVLEEMFEDD